MTILSDTSQQVLCKQYFRRGDTYPVCNFCGIGHESLEELFERVSFGDKYFYKMISSFDFLPNSPTIFNAGGNGTLSACFKFDVHDTMESILDVDRRAALVQKWGGGVGYCLSELREKGAPIRSTHGHACGVVAVMRKFQSTAELITQGGKRAGAQMAILDCSHPDIEEFIHCKEVEGALDTFNISVAVSDDFMKSVRVQLDGRENRLFEEIVECAWRNGDPGLYFIDVAEKENPTPWLGVLNGTNPCGEVPLLDNESCNLGSINLSHFVEGELFDFERLGVVSSLAVRYLDDVVDSNFYVIPEIAEATLRTRKLGLGVMGWADTLARLCIPYDSQEAVDLAVEVMKKIQCVAHAESELLASERGAYGAWNTDREQCLKYGSPDRRNACVTCIAPAGSISTIACCSSGIEPHYSLVYTQVMGDGTKLKRRVEFADFIPKTANEIGWSWHVKHQAAFQKHTDLAVSKTINMPNKATIEDVRGAYLLAWELGCKGITVYREGSRVKQAMYKDSTVVDTYQSDATHGKGRRKLGKDCISLRHKFDVDDVEGYIHIGFFPDGDPGEVFIDASKLGSTISGLLDGVAILTSLGLQYGVPLEAIVEKLQGTRFEPYGLTSNVKIPTTSSLLDYIFRHLALACGSNNIHFEASGMLCPECGAAVIFQEGCMCCASKCGWSRC